MKNLVDGSLIEIAIKNIRNRNSIAQIVDVDKRIKYIKTNKETTSNSLNNRLTKFTIGNSKKSLPKFKVNSNNKTALQQDALKSTTNPSSDLLTYKGINLGSAINMKLSVQLASLLKDKDL